MKKFLALLLFAGIMISTCACGQDAADAPMSTATESTEEESVVEEVDVGNVEPYARDDGYTVWGLQSISADEYPNIVGYNTCDTSTDPRGYYNILIRDNQDNRLKVSDSCTDKTGKHGEFTKAIINGQEFVNEDFAAQDFARVMAKVNEKTPVDYISSAFGSSDELKALAAENKGKINQTEDYFLDLYNKIVDTGAAMFKVEFSPEGDQLTFHYTFHFGVDDSGIRYWYGVVKTHYGHSDPDYCCVEFADEKIAINMADVYNGELVFARYGESE